MKSLRYRLVPLLLLAARGAMAANTETLDPNLEPLRRLVGKTFKGEFVNSTPAKPVVDVMRWERALNGKAVRLLHAINDGEYGGETIFMWDEKNNRIGYHYFTTAGYMTVGNLTIKDGKWTSHEEVTNSKGGVTAVRATTELRDDGTLHVTAEYQKDGQWQAGHEVTYHEDPAAKVVFK